MTLYRPDSLDSALSLLGKGGMTVLAGGTDVYPGLRDGAPPAHLLDISGIAGLRGIARAGGQWRIGAATTWTDVIRADLPPLFDGLKLAAREVGSVQIQNSGTVAGNLCNASPAADGVPVLMALDALVEVQGPGGSRQVPLTDFIAGPRAVALDPGELVTAVLIPDGPGQGAFLKLGARRYLVISIAMVGAVIATRSGRIDRARVAVGSCGPVARRLTGVETALTGAAPGDVARLVAAADLPELAPIDDVRATATYRNDAARTLIARAILMAMEAPHVA
ncbi:FAD binding domain-containing protein [Actibacterium ureilyticum]|uniref:FAD binding domain-containing protein n=1 Tax=Actibacterium ureilyticum TaxID=1590614 RepID=UPI000BAAD650|nr:xanthine dehydrogenase family protein subunit M [Actibacterium ureilyticum]